METEMRLSNEVEEGVRDEEKGEKERERDEKRRETKRRRPCCPPSPRLAGALIVAASLMHVLIYSRPPQRASSCRCRTPSCPSFFREPSSPPLLPFYPPQLLRSLTGQVLLRCDCEQVVWVRAPGGAPADQHGRGDQDRAHRE